MRRIILLAGALVLLGGSLAIGSAQTRDKRPTPVLASGEFRSEPLTPLERKFLAHARAEGEVIERQTRPPQGANARGLILSRGIARRIQKLKTSQTKDLRDYSLDFSPSGSIHAKSREEENNQCRTMY